jgi:hypothetical protein
MNHNFFFPPGFTSLTKKDKKNEFILENLEYLEKIDI